MTKDEALKLALEALEVNLGTWSAKKKAIPVIKEVLAQPEQEPVAWMYEFGTDHCDAVTPVRWYKNVTSLEKPDPEKSLVRNVVPLYTRPQPAAQWVGLTDEEIDAILKRGDVAEHDAWNGRWYVLPYSFARAIEAVLKEKNT